MDLEDRKRLWKYINNFGRGTRSCAGMDDVNMDIYLTLERLFAPFTGFGLTLDNTFYERDVKFHAYFFRAFPRKGSNHIKAIAI